MKEDFLQFIWKMQLFQPIQLRTVKGEHITVLKPGHENRNEGPDFLNASIDIDGHLWAGHVEIHARSSDWYVHLHQLDANYNATILHVVWEYDVPVYSPGKVEIPTIVLKEFVSQYALDQQRRLFEKDKKWIYCENLIDTVEDFKIEKWLEELYFERLQRKVEGMKKLLADSNSNWEEVLFWSLAKNFGLKINGDNFLEIAQSISFSVFRKLTHSALGLEALLFGQAGLLIETAYNDPYFKELQKEYDFLKRKFSLEPPLKRQVNFFRLRPPSFPTIRLSQFAHVYKINHSLFRSVMDVESSEELKAIFNVAASEYWNNHYVFEKETLLNYKKRLSANFIQLILVNTILPLRFLYRSEKIDFNIQSQLGLIEALPSEKNTIVSKFKLLNVESKTAMHSQALIQLKTKYCDSGNCLSCKIGKELLQNQS